MESSSAELVQDADDHEADDHEADDHEAEDQEADDHEADDHEADDQEADDHEAEDQEADDHEAELQDALSWAALGVVLAALVDTDSPLLGAAAIAPILLVHRLLALLAEHPEPQEVR